MKKIAALAALSLLALAVPAQGAPHSKSPPPPGSHRCAPHNTGYNATGTLVSASLTPEEHNRYGGTLEVDLARANHRAPTGDQTFTLSAARVRFHRGVDSTSPAAGSRVKLHGKVTALAKRCPSEGFTPTVTVGKVDISTAAHRKG
jgi:hypothetical protein